MIFVTLGTQDKEFPRLLEAIEIQIKKGNIKEKVIVQAGCTKFKSDSMEIFDLISPEKFEQYIEQCDLLITHGGVGSILTGLNYGKKIIAAPRLKKYKEHVNDHQLQIVEKLAKDGYILELKDFSKLGKVLEKAKTFHTKKYQSGRDHMVSLVEDFIDRI